MSQGGIQTQYLTNQGQLLCHLRHHHFSLLVIMTQMTEQKNCEQQLKELNKRKKGKCRGVEKSCRRQNGFVNPSRRINGWKMTKTGIVGISHRFMLLPKKQSWSSATLATATAATTTTATTTTTTTTRAASPRQR